MATYKGLPNVLIILFALIVIYSFITKQTVVGRRIFALGGNEKAAQLSGVNTKRLKFLTFANMGMLAALGGIGTVIGAVIGALVMGVMNNGMSIVGIGIDWQQAIKGTVLALAVWFDVRNRDKS